jgi:hypothetical protein
MVEDFYFRFYSFLLLATGSEELADKILVNIKVPDALEKDYFRVACKEFDQLTPISSYSLSSNYKLDREFVTHLSFLPRLYRIVFLLKDIERFSIEEVAELLERSTPEIRFLLSRSRRMLIRLNKPHFISAPELGSLTECFQNDPNQLIPPVSGECLS